MKKIAIWLLCLLMTPCLQAQNYEALNSFMQKYCQNWNEGYLQMGTDDMPETIVQLGTTIPDFHLNDTLNSRSLRGRFVVLNFWATWCTGCRWLSTEIDTVMFRRTEADPGVQVIGVNAHERLADKGFHADKWWRERDIRYPSSGGYGADVLCDTLHGGHPSAFLIDGEGIIRGRWDAWSPGVADFIAFSVWALKDMPAQGVTPCLRDVEALMDESKWIHAAFLLEQMVGTPETDALLLKCLLRFSPLEAANLIGHFENYKLDNAYDGLMRTIVSEVLACQTADTRLLKQALEASVYLLNHNRSQDLAVYEEAALVRVRYGEACIKQGKNLAKSGLDVAKRQQADAATLSHWEELLSSLGIE